MNRCPLGCNTATEKAMWDVIAAVIKPRKHFTTAECLNPPGFTEIPVQELQLSEMQSHTHNLVPLDEPVGKGWGSSQDRREKELNSTIPEGNSSGNLRRLNTTWYLSRSNISNYTILIINIQHVPEVPFFNLLLDKLVSFKWPQRKTNPIHCQGWKRDTWDQNTPQNPVDVNWPLRSH